MSEQPVKLEPEVEELVKYFDEVLADYRKYVDQIGQLKFAAPQLLYYRDEIQDLLDALSAEPGVDMKSRWVIIREYDLKLRAKASTFVHEVGHSNFKQYQIINNPPLTRWWWYMNRITVNQDHKIPSWQWWRRESSGI